MCICMCGVKYLHSMWYVHTYVCTYVRNCILLHKAAGSCRPGNPLFNFDRFPNAMHILRSDREFYILFESIMRLITNSFGNTTHHTPHTTGLPLDALRQIENLTIEASFRKGCGLEYYPLLQLSPFEVSDKRSCTYT